MGPSPSWGCGICTDRYVQVIHSTQIVWWWWWCGGFVAVWFGFGCGGILLVGFFFFSQIADWTLLFCFWFFFNTLICLLFSQKISWVLTNLSHVAKPFSSCYFKQEACQQTTQSLSSRISPKDLFSGEFACTYFCLNTWP